MWFVSHDAHVC